MKTTREFTFIIFLIGASLLVACGQAGASTAESTVPATEPIDPATEPSDSSAEPSASTVTPISLPAGGALGPGTYFFPHRSISDYQRIIFTLPAGWATSNGFVYKHLGEPDEVAFSAWVPDQVYADPCHWQASALGPLDLSNHYDDVSGAFILTPADGGLANQAFRGSIPLALTDVMVGGEPALRIDLSVPADLDISTCDQGQFRSWTDASAIGGANSHHASGQLDAVYEVDLDRKALVIDASHMPATSETDLADLNSIIASMVIDRDWSADTPTTTPSPQIYIPDVAPEIGSLNPGIYTLGNLDEAGFNVRFTVPAGWTWNGRYLSKGDVDQPDGAAIFFFGGPMVQVHTDPCHWVEEQPNSAYWLIGRSAVDLMASLVSQPMDSSTTPIIRFASSLGMANGWPGMTVELTAPEDLNLGACDGRQYRRWGPEINAQFHVDPGQRDLVWVVEIDGAGTNNAPPPPGGLIIDATSFQGTPADVMSEIEAILGSIIVGHWG